MKKVLSRSLALSQLFAMIIVLLAVPSVLFAQVKAWGNNTYGQLGTGDNNSRPTPTTLSGLNDIVDISAGPDIALALRRNGTVLSWGSNTFGRLGTGSTTPTQTNVPVPVINLTGVVAVAAGGRACLAIKSDGTLWVWGSNYYAEFGDGTRSNDQNAAFPTPRQVPGLPAITAVSVTVGGHVLALDSQGKVWGWGINQYGEVNYQNPAVYVQTPEQIAGFPAGTVITRISSSIGISEALTSAGEVYVWGSNYSGEDGLGQCNVLSAVIGLPKRVITSGVTQIAATVEGMAALQTNGNVLFWGANAYGQAGNNTSTVCTAFVNATITGVTDIRAGDQHFLARKSNGTIWGWGYNSDCQIGSGSCPFADQLPVQTQVGAGNGRIFDAGGRSGFISNPLPASRPFDFDGDGKTDASVYRPSTGDWYLLRSTAGFGAFHFGSPSDVLTPADFTGDGKTDIAVFRPSVGTWFVLRSEDSTFYGAGFGTAGDTPTPGDFDGDGKADLAVFRPGAQAYWYLQQSTAGFAVVPFGTTGDVPAAGDYDGDGKNDVSVYRPSLGQWFRFNSGNGSFYGVQFGAVGDMIVPADYTGDGKTDNAVFRPSTSTWYILRSEQPTFYGAGFGTAGDLPSPGDYDGDGKADLAVWRSGAQSVFYIQATTAGFSAIPWGITGDRPTANAYVY